MEKHTKQNETAKKLRAGGIVQQRLEDIKDERGLTQKEMASAVNVSEGLMTAWMNGEKAPGTESLIKISKGLNVSIDYLLGLLPRNANTTNLKLRCISSQTGLSLKSIKTLSENLYAQLFINALIESVELNDLSRSFKRLLISAGIYIEDGKRYDYLEKPVPFPILDDEEGGDSILLHDKMKEHNMDMIKFCEWLLRDTFESFTESIVRKADPREASN